MSCSHSHMPRSAFTLIELLISLAIGLLLVSVAFAGFRQVRKTVDRSTARLDMHQRAAVAYRGLRADLSAQMPNCAMFIRSLIDDPTTPDVDETAVEVVFMRGKIDIDNWSWGSQSTLDNNSDMVWAQWRWTKSSGTLAAGVNRWQRKFTNQIDWQPPSGPATNNLNGKSFTVIPLPLREVDTIDPWKSLDLNVIRTDPTKRDPEDLGDGEDLRHETRPVIHQVTACTVQLVMSDGSARTYDGSLPTTDVFKGIPMDGKLVDADFAKSAIARRPRLLRLRFTLRDPRLDLDQSFSYSLQLPGVLPGPPP